MKKTLINKNAITIAVHILIMLSAFFTLTFSLDADGLWYDEAFTAAITDHGFIDIIKLTAGDNHPPLYYLIVKLFKNIFGGSVLTLRSVSVTAALLLISLGLGPVRKIFGNKMSVIYSILTAVFPVFISFARDARMYAPACFFVTAAALYCYLSCIEKKIYYWLITSLFALAASYTHIYGFIAVFFIYLFAFIRTLLKRNNKTVFVLISVFFNLAAYLPWLIIIFFQLQKVLRGFWIPQVDMLTFFMLFQYIYTDKFFYFSFSFFSIAGSFFLLLIASMGLINVIKKNHQHGMMTALSLFTVTGTLLTGLILSIILKPVFLPRFMFITYGLAVIIISYGIHTLKNKYAAIISILLITAFAAPQIITIYTKNFSSSSGEASEYIKEKIQKDDIFIHATEQAMGVFYYYFPDYKHFLYLRQGDKGYGNYDVFKPNARYGPYLNESLKNAQRFWMINYIEHLNVIPHHKIVQSGNFKKIYSKVFVCDNLFNTISVSCYERTELIIPQKKGNIKINIKEIISNNKKGRVVVRIYDHIMFEYRNALIKTYINNKNDIIKINNKFFLKKIERYIPDEFAEKDENIRALISAVFELSPDGNYYLLNEKALSDENQHKILKIIGSFEKKYLRTFDITDSSLQCEFQDIPYGEYVIECFHDENSNNFLDYKGLKITEGYGISGNTKNTLPDFEVNSFMLDEDEKMINIQLKNF